MINGRILNKYLKESKDKRPSKLARYFSPYQDDWYYQSVYSSMIEGEEFYPYTASKPGATDEERIEHLTEPKLEQMELPLEEPKLHPKQMELLLEEVHDQFDHQANKPEERDIAREMCQDLLDRHASNIFKPVYIDPPEGWKYGFPKALPTGEPDILAWLITEGYPQSVMDRYGDAFTYRILDSEE